MKKWSYLLSGMLIGAVVATAGSAFADQIKSLVGHTVAGEYSVKVNDSSLTENAIVVDGKAHVPLRAVSDSLGAGVKVDGKTIQILTDKSSDTSKIQLSNTNVSSVENKDSSFDKVVTSGEFKDWSITRLEMRKGDLEKSIPVYEKSKQGYIESLEKYNKFRQEYSGNKNFMEKLDVETNEAEEQLQKTESAIAKYKSELEEINKAIAALK
ncbi:stalk domain-containing protein [Paenibacillus polymyxa]|uniref:stalk domain-containing protein n=1 Tax=Paenibacillus polymyxa TaxID=1406 RepID=UPI001C9DBB5F|nr:stalk domain-containing protein [Paenibacillus polymyxa]MBY7736271.1 2,' 3'-cyclic nucleotide 2'-phosphodiesterase [Paenibacillus polymyxa]UMR33665.1 stalk domain-containing protein [Paenibacillus polymyxa]